MITERQLDTLKRQKRYYQALIARQEENIARMRKRASILLGRLQRLNYHGSIGEREAINHHRFPLLLAMLSRLSSK